MGCGGSTFAEDGSINPGKGEVKLELDENCKLKLLFFWPDKGDAIGCEVKKAEGKEMVTAPWERVTTGKDQAMWAEITPGPYMMRYVVDERRCNHHEDAGLDLPSKIFFAHQKAPAVFTKMCYHFSKGKEGCPYAAENGEKLCEEDLNKMEHYVSSHQLGEFLEPLRKALTTIEDLMPGNRVDATANVSYDLGYWDRDPSGNEVRVLGGMEKARLMAEAKIMNPKQARMIQMKTAEILRQIIVKTMDATCKTIKMTKEELLPTLDALLDIMEGRKPGSIPRTVEADATEYPDISPDSMEAEKLEIIKKLWEADKKDMLKMKAEDIAPEFARKKIVENAVDKLVQKLRDHYEAKFDPKKVEPGTWVMARYKGSELYEAKSGTTHADGSIQFTWPQTKLEEEETLWVQPVEKVKVKRGFPPKEVEEDRINVARMPPNADASDLTIGMKVRFRSERWGNFADGTVVDVVGGKAVVKDRYNEINVDVAPERIWMQTKLVDVAKGTRIIPQNFYDVSFWWIESEVDIISVKMNVWRVGAREDTLQSIEMESIKKPAKPTKKVPEPDFQVHVGFRGNAKVQLGRDYAINFVKKYMKKQGEAKVEAEETFVDFGKVAKDEFSFRRFAMKLNV